MPDAIAATSYSWNDNVAGGDWADGTQRNPNAPAGGPTSGDTANIDKTTGPIVSSPVAVAAVHIGNTGIGTLNITSSGTIGSAEARIGQNSGSTGTATVDGATWKNNGNDFFIGSGGTGTLVVENNGDVSNVIAGTYFRVGNNNGSNGTLVITSGGTISATVSQIGQYAGSTGTVMVTGNGSTWTNTNDVDVGNSGSGTLMLSEGGTLTVGGTVNIANQAGSTGALNIGSAAGNAPVAAGMLNAKAVQFGPGTGTINFNHTGNVTFAPSVSGTGTINALAGNTVLAGDTSGFTGNINVTPGANVTTGAQQAASLRGTANRVHAAMITSRSTAGELLGANRPMEQRNDTSAGAMFGSAEGMAGAQAYANSVTVIGGVAYGERDTSQLDEDSAATIAAAARYTFDDTLHDNDSDQTLTPFVEVGGWVTPNQSMTLQRSYDMVGGSATASGSTDTTAYAGYARAGAVWNNGPNQVVGYGEIGQQVLSHDAYAETGGPFPAQIDDGVMRFKVARLGGSYTRDITGDAAPIPMSVTVSAAAAYAFDAHDDLRGNIAGATFSASPDGSATWGEFGARVEAGVTEDTSVSVGVTGTAGSGDHTSAVHGLVGVSHKF